MIMLSGKTPSRYWSSIVCSFSSYSFYIQYQKMVAERRRRTIIGTTLEDYIGRKTSNSLLMA